jgi:hypothetical protein
MAKNEAYWQWVREEAERVGSDGCTGVPDFHLDCCLEHDLAYRSGRDPRVAFRNGWDAAPDLERAIADERFKQCIQDESPLGKLSPMAAVRWLGVRLGRFLGVKYGPK